MGVWGTGPFDNDTAGDMVAGMVKHVRRVADAAAGKDVSGDYEAARAAIEFIVAAHGTDILGGPPIQLTIKALIRMRNDSEWLAGWENPRSIARALKTQIDRIYEIVVHCKRCRKSGAIVAVETMLVEPFTKLPKSGHPRARR